MRIIKPFALLVPLLVLGVATPAVAEQTTHDDPAGDVISRATFGEFEEELVPGDRKRDITAIKTIYADQKLAVTVDLRNLDTNYSFTVRITTSEGGHYWVSSQDSPGTGEDSLNLYEVNTKRDARQVLRGGGSPVECPNLDVVRLLETERLRIVVPRSCISAPASVRTGALMRAFYDKGHERLDDARRNADIGPDGVTTIRLGSSVSYN